MVYTLQEGVRTNRRKWQMLALVTFVLIVTVVATDLPSVVSGRSASELAGLVRAKKTATAAEPTRSKGSSHAPPTKRDSSPSVQYATVQAAASVSQANDRAEQCVGAVPAHTGLAHASSPGLKKMADYESVCGSAVATGGSFFVATPRTVSEAVEYGRDTAARLREYASFGIRPIIFMEPTFSGGILDFGLYSSGAYDEALSKYFTVIKEGGVSDATLGLWVLFPEGNIPVWNNVDPATYAVNVARTAQILKSQFPAGKVGLLLDSQSYPSGSSWAGGQYKSLLPYVSSIPPGLIDSFGLQGFPWASPANEPGGSLFEPQTYLAVGLAAEAAHALGVQEVWVNTGTFSVAYAASTDKRVALDPQARQVMLDGVITQVKTLAGQGFTVAVHLFAEDKSQKAEGIDWSYWPALSPGSGAHTRVFKNFVHDLNAAGIPLWLFDAS